MTRMGNLFMPQECVSMKIEELRVDSLVLNKQLNNPHKITPQDIYSLAEGMLREDVFEPIKLTVETIDKNFKKSDRFKGFWELGGLYSITENSNYGFILCTLDMDEFGGGYYVPAIPCTYFHELQNLLVDLRIDKKIEI